MEGELQKEYDRGYFDAEEAAAYELAEAQAEMIEEQHKVSLMLGYNRGLDDAGVEPNDERRTLVKVPPRDLAEGEQLEPTNEPTNETTKAITTLAPSDDPTLSLFTAL